MTLGDTDKVDALVGGEDLCDWHLLLEVLAGPVNLGEITIFHELADTKLQIKNLLADAKLSTLLG